MKPDQTAERLRQTGIIAVVRAPAGAPLADASRALLAGGVEAIEITFTVPNATEVIALLQKELGDRILLGAGTVLDSAAANSAVAAGARFLVSPAVVPEVAQTARRLGAAALLGGWTPTELLAAWQAGSELVKLFPCDVGGPGYLKALAGPLPQIPLVPTGGITLENAGDFIRAGAVALGVGGSLVEAKALAARDFSRIEHQARLFRQAVDAARAAI